MGNFVPRWQAASDCQLDCNSSQQPARQPMGAVVARCAAPEGSVDLGDVWGLSDQKIPPPPPPSPPPPPPQIEPQPPQVEESTMGIPLPPRTEWDLTAGQTCALIVRTLNPWARRADLHRCGGLFGRGYRTPSRSRDNASKLPISTSSPSSSLLVSTKSSDETRIIGRNADCSSSLYQPRRSRRGPKEPPAKASGCMRCSPAEARFIIIMRARRRVLLLPPRLRLT
jgi:hypothetical protein